MKPALGPVLGPVLGIESSCDETAVAVLDADGRILAEAVLSQEADHAPYGGVVPEIAARAHLASLPDLVQRVLTQASVTYSELGAVTDPRRARARPGCGSRGALAPGSAALSPARSGWHRDARPPACG